MKSHGRRAAATLLATSAALAGAVVLAPQALANTFSGNLPVAGYAYDDPTDTFCIKSSPNGTVRVTLTPDNASRGPSRSISASNNAGSCTSLATAYEDSGYTARISTYQASKTVHFFS